MGLYQKVSKPRVKKYLEGRQMPSKGNINIVHDEQIWRDHIRTGMHTYYNYQESTCGYQQNEHDKY